MEKETKQVLGVIGVGILLLLLFNKKAQAAVNKILPSGAEPDAGGDDDSPIKTFPIDTPIETLPIQVDKITPDTFVGTLQDLGLGGNTGTTGGGTTGGGTTGGGTTGGGTTGGGTTGGTGGGTTGGQTDGQGGQGQAK